MRQWIGHALARYLTAPGRTATIGYPTDNALLAACVSPGDVILVDGDSRVGAGMCVPAAPARRASPPSPLRSGRGTGHCHR